MHRVDQTTFGWWRPPYEPGNCLSACVASILGLSIDEVPNFISLDDSYEEQWADRLDAWLASLGLRAAHVPVDASTVADLSAVAPDALYVLCGRSVRDFEHAVVASGDQVVHDPHFSRTGLRSAHRMIFILPGA